MATFIVRGKTLLEINEKGPPTPAGRKAVEGDRIDRSRFSARTQRGREHAVLDPPEPVVQLNQQASSFDLQLCHAELLQRVVLVISICAGGRSVNGGKSMIICTSCPSCPASEIPYPGGRSRWPKWAVSLLSYQIASLLSARGG